MLIALHLFNLINSTFISLYLFIIYLKPHHSLFIIYL